MTLTPGFELAILAGAVVAGGAGAPIGDRRRGPITSNPPSPRAGLPHAHPPPPSRRAAPQRRPLGLGLLVGAATLSGLRGSASGPLKLRAMDVAMDLPIKVSTATSNFMIGITGLASAIVYLERGQVLLALVAPIALGVVAGAAVGTRMLPKLPAATIRSWFVVVLAAIVAQMLYRGVMG